MSNTQLLTHFYTSFQQKDFASMQACYHPEAIFSDPAFQNLNCQQTKAMWQMLISRGKDMDLAFSGIVADDLHGSAKWNARYTFSKTQRKVHNFITSEFEFKDNKIYRHTDSFSFSKWSAQALGLPGIMLGWSSFLQNKVRKEAMMGLDAFMKSM
jgi:ketosteroid isomerase-like protein